MRTSESWCKASIYLYVKKLKVDSACTTWRPMIPSNTNNHSGGYVLNDSRSYEIMPPIAVRESG